MTPEEYIKIRTKELAEQEASRYRVLAAYKKASLCPVPKDLRKATAADIIEGAILWYPEHVDEDGPEENFPGWKVVDAVRYPDDDFKAYVADDGCRYGLDALKFEVAKDNLLRLIECELADRGMAVYCGKVNVSIEDVMNIIK